MESVVEVGPGGFVGSLPLISVKSPALMSLPKLSPPLVSCAEEQEERRLVTRRRRRTCIDD